MPDWCGQEEQGGVAGKTQSMRQHKNTHKTTENKNSCPTHFDKNQCQVVWIDLLPWLFSGQRRFCVLFATSIQQLSHLGCVPFQWWGQPYWSLHRMWLARSASVSSGFPWNTESGSAGNHCRTVFHRDAKQPKGCSHSRAEESSHPSPVKIHNCSETNDCPLDQVNFCFDKSRCSSANDSTLNWEVTRDMLVHFYGKGKHIKNGLYHLP